MAQPENTNPPRTERAQQILDAAADLLLRWGYKRITIEDVAKQAGVGTGTVYLHWKTKEALFESVLLRELLTIWRTLIQRMRDDPREALLHRFLRAQFLIIWERPLARALFTQNGDLLGKLAHSPIARQAQPVGSAHEMIGILRNLNIMRADSSLAAQSYAFSAAVTGFAFVDQFLSGADVASREAQADAVELLVRRTFAPDEPPTDEALRTLVAPTLIQFLEQACVYYEQQLQARMIAT
jgi:AcrR family transcriptional regulator